MNSGVRMAAANPLALLLGLGGQKIPSNPEGMPGFGELLNPGPLSTPGAAGGEPSTLVMNPNTDQQSDNTVPIVISGNLLSLLGLTALSTGELINTLSANDGPVLAQAEVLTPDDGDGEMIYLRIRTSEDTGAELAELTDDKGERQEMILAMRLRTVEHRDGRIIADGAIQKATGEDVPIRLQMQVAENAIPESTFDVNAVKPGTESMTGKTETNGPDMARMLADLKAEMIVIEPAAAETTPELRMPFADIMGRSERSIKAVNATPSQVMAEAASISVEPIASQTPTAMPTVAEASPAASADIPVADEDVPNMVDQLIGREGTSSAAKADGSATPAASTLTATGNTGSVGTSQQTSGTTQVRFYDIDNKLEQVKQNPGQRIKIQLVPSNLGRMELSIVSHRGLVTVNLAVESSQARQAVEKSLPQLEQRLASSGIKVDAVQLQVNHPNRNTTFANNHQQYYQGGHGGNGGRGSQQSPYRSARSYRMQTPDAGFKQELVNCLA